MDFIAKIFLTVVFGVSNFKEKYNMRMLMHYC